MIHCSVKYYNDMDVRIFIEVRLRSNLNMAERSIFNTAPVEICSKPRDEIPETQLINNTGNKGEVQLSKCDQQ